MKFLLINGSPHVNGATRCALDRIAAGFATLGDEVSIYSIGSDARKTCLACGGCKSGAGCVIGDIGSLADEVRAADGIIIGTPTHYAAPSGTLISVLTRLVRSSRAEIHGKPIATVAVGRRGGVCGAAEALHRYFEFCGCPIVCASYPLGILGSNDSEVEGYLDELCRNMHTVAKKLKR